MFAVRRCACCAENMLDAVALSQLKPVLPAVDTYEKLQCISNAKYHTGHKLDNSEKYKNLSTVLCCQPTPLVVYPMPSSSYTAGHLKLAFTRAAPGRCSRPAHGEACTSTVLLHALAATTCFVRACTSTYMHLLAHICTCMLFL